MAFPERIDPAVGAQPQYEEYFRAGFLGAITIPCAFPDPSKPDFRVADLTLPKSVSEQAVHSRQAFLRIVDQRYRTLYNNAEHANMDGLQRKPGRWF